MPEARAFRMALEVFQNRNYMAVRNRGVAEAVGPPFLKLLVNNHIEFFFGTVGFSICIADINANSDVVECSVDCP